MNHPAQQDFNLSNTSEVSETSSESAQDWVNTSDADWQIALTRQKIIEPLAKKGRCSRKEISEAGQALHLARSQVYLLIRRYRQANYCLQALIPPKHSGGIGKSRLPSSLEMLIDTCIQELYLSCQRIKISVLHEEIKRRCYFLDIKPPSYFAVRKRVQALPLNKLKPRNPKEISKKLAICSGTTPSVPYPLARWQIDHTKVDLIIVDDIHRQPIGRPYLTVAIDVFSRCIAGFCLTLEAPSATSVGLCLAQGVSDKTALLAHHQIDGHWPVQGKPDEIHMDNASEFHSEALTRGCQYYGIKMDYRPLGQPHFGGIVERLIGTLMQLIHQLPGTTFSSIVEKGDYPAEKLAALTLKELEKWLMVAIVNYYHRKPHGTLLVSPIKMYEESQSFNPANCEVSKLDSHQFLIDFLPIFYRRLNKTGFVLDYIHYYSPRLNALMGQRDKLGLLLIRRDPRDLSRIYVLDLIRKLYIEIPYCGLNRPPITLWEQRKARGQLKEKGRQIDERCLFNAITEMRQLTQVAVKKSKQARKILARQPEAQCIKQTEQSPRVSENSTSYENKPFDDIEVAK